MNLKEEYNKHFIKDLAGQIAEHYPSFKKEEFINSIINENWESKELKERMRHVTITIAQFLPISYQKQIETLNNIVANFRGLTGMIFPDFVEVYGMDDFKTSIQALEDYTQYFSSEFAIRPFSQKYPDKTIEQLIKWSKHSNHHVRRLASEGSRPKLPWSFPLRMFINDPSPVLPILENLKDDESEYVRKSVANHLNDISKSQPDLALKLGKKWYGKSNNLNRVVKHGLRTLLKKGDKKALAIFNLDDSTNINIDKVELVKKEFKIGEDLYFEFEVNNNSTSNRSIRLEYKIDYVKSNGSTSPKVFQISEFELEKKQVKKVKRKQSFKNFSTRKHYPGKHRVTIIANGDEKCNTTFLVNN